MEMETRDWVKAIDSMRGMGWSDERILTALGHPGYGPGFARAVLMRMRRHDCTASQAVATVLEKRKLIVLERRSQGYYGYG
jgi:hypothetical protein